VKLVDFGFAMFKRFDINNVIGGTLQYSAPEILKGEKPDVRTEIYSLGIVMYECLTGEKPFNKKSAKAIIQAVLNTPLEPIKKNKEVPSFLNQLIMKMVEKERFQRYSNIDTIIDIIVNKNLDIKKEKPIKTVLYSDFIGRKNYINNIFKLLKKVFTKKGQIVLIEGITGIGKSRLLKEIEYRFFMKGLDVRFTKTPSSETKDYRWITNLLTRAGWDDKNHKRFQNDEYIATPFKKHLFYKTIENSIVEIVKKKKQIFIIDDLNLTDSIIAELILYISRAIKDKPLFLILSSEKIPEGFKNNIKIGGYDNITLQNLEGLNKEETSLFIKNMLGVQKNTELISEFLFKKSEGNPYFIEEILKEIVNSSMLIKSGNFLSYNITEIEKLSIPTNVNNFVREKLKKLLQRERKILNIIAIFGDSVPLDWLINISPYDEITTIRICENLYQRHFLSLSEDHKYYFTHHIIQDITYSEIKKEQKIKLHRMIFEFIKTIKFSTEILPLLAYHSFEASLPEAYVYLKKLLINSLKLLDYETAIKSFERLDIVKGKKWREELDIKTIRSIGDAYYYLGKYEKTIDYYKDMLKRVKTSRGKITIKHIIAFIMTLTSQYKEAERLFMNLLKNVKNIDKRVEILIDLGWLYFSEEKYKSSQHIYENALKLSSKLKDKSIVGRLYQNLATLNLRINNLDDAQKYAEKMLTTAQSFNLKQLNISALNASATIARNRGNIKNAIELYKKAIKSLETTSDQYKLLNNLILLSKSFYITGDYKSFDKNINHALTLAQKLNKPYELAFINELYGISFSKRGNWEQAKKFFNSAEKIASSIGSYVIQLDSLIEQGLLYFFQNNNEKFQEYILKATALKKKVKDKETVAKFYLIKGIKEYFNTVSPKGFLYLKKSTRFAREANSYEILIPSLFFTSLSYLENGEKKNAIAFIQKTRKAMKNSGYFQYRKEIAFIEALLKESEDSIKKLKNLSNDATKDEENFLRAICLLTLSKKLLKRFHKTLKRETLLESYQYLKEAKEIFETLGADLFLLRINPLFIRMTDAFDKYESISLKKERYLDIFKEFSNTINKIDNPDELKKAFVTFTKKVTGAERGLFLELKADTNDFVTIGEDVDKLTIDDAKKFSRSVIKKVKQTKKPLISYDAIQDKRFSSSESVIINDIHSILCIPVMNDKEIFGTIYLDSTKKPGIFSKEDEEFFTALANLLAGSLVKSQKYKNIEDETLVLKKHLRTRFGPKNLIGKTEKMQDVFDKINSAAKIDTPVLILGETGTGKELVAATIHLMSHRKKQIFTLVDCIAIPDSLLESELFGYTKGAFTGADKEKKGLLESAKGGTLFIDEIGDAPNPIQSSLLRFLDTGEVKRIGATNYIKVDTRIIAATNKPLNNLVKNGLFREDLYYRLNKFIIHLPPLRERKEDIKLFLDYFIKKFNKMYNKNIQGVTNDAYRLLLNYNWPGNVRELESEIERCILFSNTNSYITKELLSPQISKLPSYFLPLKKMEEISRIKYIETVLNYTNGNISRTAEVLKVDRKTIQRILNNKKKQKP
ncbi:MAG: hypothetical protein B5M53_08760, partial [Candidatus Cloacimonas sp. 4484_209]